VWQQEADQRNINTVIVSLDHVIGIGALPSLEASCRSQQWRPVYLDSQAAVFVRVRTDTADLVRRLQFDCDTVRFDSPPVSRGLRGRAERFQYYLNAASILIMLDRTRDAMEALERAEGIFSDNPFLHYAKGVVLQNLGHLDQAEQELLISVELGSDDASLALARYYHQQRRYVDETRILAHAVETSTSPALLYVDLGYAQLAMGMPDKALISFDQAERESPFDEATAGGADFQERVAQGRAEAHRSLRLK
jgi:tetratricopeptide (TPR) repeat protein